LDKSTTTLTLKEPIPDLKQTQSSLFDQFEVLEEQFAKRSATIRPLKLETQIEAALISDGPQTIDDLMQRFPGTERATLVRIMQDMWKAGIVAPDDDDEWARVEA
jgi:CRP-like cAMP-binding protein